VIDLYTAPTPNGWKASITLEELELPYETHFVNNGSGEQKGPAFLAINPNGRVRSHKWSGVPVDGLEHLQRWLGAMAARPACQRGVEVPFKLPDLADDEKGAEEFAKNAREMLQR